MFHGVSLDFSYDVMMTVFVLGWKWLVMGLQSIATKCNTYIYGCQVLYYKWYAVLDSGFSVRKDVRVQIPPSAPALQQGSSICQGVDVTEL